MPKIKKIKKRASKIKEIKKAKPDSATSSESPLEGTIENEEVKQFVQTVSTGRALAPSLEAGQVKQAAPIQTTQTRKKEEQRAAPTYSTATTTTSDDGREYRSVVMQQQPTGQPVQVRGLGGNQAVRAQRAFRQEGLEESRQEKYKISEEKKSGRRKYPWEV